jgi:titin
VTHDVVVLAFDSTQRDGEPAEVISGVVPASSVLPESDGDLVLPPGTKASVAAGKTITVSGSGYAPFSTVTVLIYSTPQILTTVVTDGTGSFSVEVTVPAGLAAGQHHLVAAGVDPSGELRYLTLPVTVTGDGGATLAYTGADVVVPAIGGLLAVLTGAALLLVARRRPAS